MMTYDPAERITAAQALSDSWMREYSYVPAINKEDVLESFDALRDFQTHSSIHKAVLTYIAKYTFSKKKEQRIRGIFQTLDRNNDGQLSKEEMVEAYKKFYGGDGSAAAEQIDSTLKRIDLNRNGLIDYNGTVRVHKELCRIPDGEHEEEKRGEDEQTAEGV